MPVRAPRCALQRVPVFLVDCCYTFFLCGIFVADGSAGISGTIVHQQDLKILIGLVQDAVHAPPEIGFHIVDRDNDTDQLCFHVFFFRSFYYPDVQQIGCVGNDFIVAFQDSLIDPD